MWDALWVNANLATLDPDSDPYGAILDGAIGIRGARIAWVGRQKDLPGQATELSGHVIDAGGRWITPGLVDCHTHLVYAGDRAGEFEQRLAGASYEEIAAEGGGILSTVRATREASEEDLYRQAASRLAFLLAEGVTTVEIKSGYGLESETELRMLRVARRLGEDLPVTVRTSLLGAHALPPELQSRRDEYLRIVREQMIPRARDLGLADAVDAFCERIAFTAAECATVFQAAVDHGLPVRLHADQLSDSGGAALAARFGALSADHLEYASDDGVAAMARAGTVAVLLPGAFYFLRERRAPPIEALRRHRIPVAIATDSNPGSSPVASLLLMANMACTLWGLTPAEALEGITRNAAAALGLGHDRGVLARGKQADMAVWDVERPSELAYWIGANPCVCVVRGGAVVREARGFASGRPNPEGR